MAEPPQKRFRYATYNEKLSNISVDVGKRKGLSWEKEEFGEEEQSKTPFTVELARLELQDLTLGYQTVAGEVFPLTRTLPMTLLNLEKTIAIFMAFFAKLKDGDDNQNSGLDSVLFLLQALYETCLGETTLYVEPTVGALVRVGALRHLEPKLVERTYSTLSLVLRTMAPQILKAENAAILSGSWEQVRTYLAPGSNKPYVRKCIADAWAGVLRKARGEALQRLMSTLTAEPTNGMEAVWANSMKGTANHLHSRAVPIFTVLLDELLANPTPEAVVTLRHVVTGLVHHCSSSETAPLIEAVLERTKLSESTSASSSKAAPSADFVASTAVLEVLAAFLYTRKGKRFPTAMFKPTMLKLQSLIPNLKTVAADSPQQTDEQRAERSQWRSALIAAIVGSLAASTLTHWLSPGVQLIDTLWSALPTPEAFAFVNMCIAFKWAGVEQFLLAHIARAALTGLVNDPLATLILLNNLAAAGYLSGGLSNVQGGRWRQSLVTAIAKLLKSLQDSKLEISDRRVLGQVLKLIPHLAGESAHFTEHLLGILDRFLDARNSEEQNEWRADGPWNDTHVTGRVLQCIYQLALRGPAGVQEELRKHAIEKDLGNALLESWSWSHEIQAQTAAFAEHWPELALDAKNVELVVPTVMSADSVLRLSSIRILAVSAKQTKNKSAEIWDLCIAVEKSEMGLRNVRERTSAIARLVRHLEVLDGSDTETFTTAITYLVSQLKVNYRPVWGETVTALSNLAGSHADAIWAVIWGEIQKTIVTDKQLMPDLGVTNPEWTSQRAEAEIEEEGGDEDIEFQCGGLNGRRTAVIRAWQQNNDTTRLDVAEISAQISSDRLDVISYEGQLLAVLTATPSMAEKHTRLIVPVVLAIAGADASEAAVELAHLSTRALQSRTISFLELFAKFVNPKAAYRSADLHELYLTLLSKGESTVQTVALRCLLTYKSPNLVPYQESLRNLLNEQKFRDALLHLDLSAESEVIEPQHRVEFMDVTIRLLYGIMMSRRARSSTAQGQGARKQAVLSSLAGSAPGELITLINLMLEPFGGFNEADPAQLSKQRIVSPGRQQLGFLSFLQDVLKYLAAQIVPHWPRLIGAVTVLVRQAQEGIDAEKAAEDAEEVEEDDEEAEVDADDKGAAPLRSIRSMGLKRLVQLMKTRNVDFDFSPFLPAIFEAVISPRLERLEIENTQAPSGTLDLIAALASSPETAHALVKYDDRTLPKTFACMTAVKVKPAVIGRVFDVIDSLLIDEDETIIQDVLLPHIRPLLDNVIALVQSLRAAANEDIMRRLLGILSRLSSVVTDGQQAQQLASLLGPMLRQPGKQVSEKAKVNILLTLQRLYAISPDFADAESAFFTQNYDMISNLFQTLYLPTSRRALVGALQVFASTDASLAPSIDLVAELNSYKVKRIDEPDFDRRLAAFAKLVDEDEDVETMELPTTGRAWLPILRSALFFIQEPEELSIRTNASSVLQRFIGQVGDASEGTLVDSLSFVVMPALRRILLSKIELVRNEVLIVLAAAVRTCTGVPVLAEMRPLLGDDDETNTFVNFSHIQVHRRARAVRRLREIISQGGIRETTISTIWLPLLEHIINGATDVTDHHLVNEAINSIGALAGQLGWSKYNALIMRYLRLGGPKATGQKFYIRCVSALIDNFHFDLGGNAIIGVTPADDEETLAEASEPTDEEAEPAVNPNDRIIDAVLGRLLPALNAFMSQKGETEDTVRIPLALATVKLAHALPAASSDNEVLRIITTVSQILRSKDQDTRDIARDTVGKIAVYLGPTWLVRVLRELRTALQRGPQKHVLAVTTHSILVLATGEPGGGRFDNLDGAVTDAVDVSAEVIWGESGRDVETEGFKTKMREVRGAASRANDTFQLVARLISPGKLGALLAPVREVMHVSQAVKTMQQVDEVLRRIALGLNANAQLGPEDILNLCFSLINGNSAYLKPKKKEPKKKADKSDRFTVQMKRNMKEEEDVYPQNAHKFVTFGLELFVTAFRRGKFDFDNVDILARLGPLVNAIGNTLYSPTSSILVLGLKATAAIAKCPVPAVDAALPTFVTNIFKVLKNAGGTAESDVAQTAIKTLAVLIRDCKATELSDSQLKYLIEVISPDLEEHSRQSAIFTLLRAIVARRFVVPEIYDLLERVSAIMVTSQSTHVQEASRGVLMQFLLDYPQGPGRLKSQMTFLARNLDYVFETGRVSVMEVLSAVFKKFSAELVEEYADMFFVALLAVVANDDSEKCRTMAGALLQQMYGSLSPEHRAKTTAVLRSWIDARTDNDALAAAAMAVYGLLAEATGEAMEEEDEEDNDLIAQLPAVLEPVLADSARALTIAEESDMELELDPGLPQHALAALARGLRARPSIATEISWPDVVSHILFPHEWVRFGAARALSTLFATHPPSNEGSPAGDDAMSILGAESLLDIARKSCVLLGGSKDAETGEAVVVDAKLADQLVKLLWNIAKYWAADEQANPTKAADLKAAAAATLAGEEAGAADEDDDDDEETEEDKNPLPWLMSRLSFLARRLIINRPSANLTLPGHTHAWTGPVMCILRFFAGVTATLSTAQARRFLVHILAPVYRILDDGGDLASMPGDGGIDELRTLATEVREFVQAKVGTSMFSKAWDTLRRKVGAKRAERREGRARMAVAEPERWAARQEKRGQSKKDSKKRKVNAFMDSKRARQRRD